MTSIDHPLSMLTTDEIARAVASLRATGRLGDQAQFAHVVLNEPDKETLAAWATGEPIPRSARAQIVPNEGLTLIEAVVDLNTEEVREWREIEGMRPALLFGEAFNAIATTVKHPEYLAALAKRGITDTSKIQIDPWPAGSFGYDCEEGRRIARCISFLREFPADNGYARPIEGLIVHFDMGRNEVIEVIDHGAVSLPQQHARYTPDEHQPLRTDLKPIAITQPDGPSFAVEGNLVTWQKWSLRLTFDPYEGLVIHQVTYDDKGRVRPIMHRASITEMVVPYGDPAETQGFKNAFDAGEWGLGRMAQSLSLGCDCLGEIHYFDAALTTEAGDPYTLSNAICMHEEDYGILWKHVDLFGDTSEVRRSRRLVVSFISTVGNYEYGFYWYFYLDGNIQLEVKLTGIVSPMSIEPGDQSEFANVIAPGVAAPHHQHMFSARLDLDVDGTDNEVYEVEAETMPTGPENPWGNAFRPKTTLLEREGEAKRVTNSASSRCWKVVNPHAMNGLGFPVAYKLIPTMSTPTLLAQPDSSVGKRAGFARHNLWVTPYAPDERRAAGDYPNQHEGGDGLPLWTEQDRPIADTDVVLWYTFGITHFVRPEDWPVMPVEYTGFLLSPMGFFDRNPALDVPPSSAAHCHSNE
ncbi:MAG: primary-amine oxidase [Acidimicrobiia bacterium]|nr:primary-amine oxidase [Acidimicrobiia bacterium]